MTRVAGGGRVLVPDDRTAPVQVIDVHDVAEWTLRMADAGINGVYNATGPDTPLTLGATLQACRDATDTDAEFAWVAPQFLLDQGVQPWTEMLLCNHGNR